MLEEAKKMYISDARSSTPAGDLSDNVSESGSVTRELIFGRRIPKVGIRHMLILNVRVL